MKKAKPIHWDHGGRPFCGAGWKRGYAGPIVRDETEVTCERCIRSIGCQELAGGAPLR